MTTRYINEDESYEHSLAYHAMVTLGEALYVIGGYTTVKYLNSAKKFDPVTKTWSEVYLLLYAANTGHPCGFLGVGSITRAQ